MAYREEKFVFNEEERFRVFETKEEQGELHCHACLELNYIESGKGTYVIDGKMYPIETGDIFVINNSEHHIAIHQDETVRMTVLVFDMDFLWRNPMGARGLKPFFNRSDNFSHRIIRGQYRYEEMYHAFLCMKKEYAEGNLHKNFVAESAAQLLLTLLYQHYDENREIAGNDSYDYASGAIQKAFSYIHEHFMEKITLEDVAQASSLSRTYLSRHFKKMTGQTLFDYIQQTRIKYAAYLLKTGRDSVAKIAVDCGFESVSYFNRIFKKCYGMSPGQYRKTGKE